MSPLFPESLHLTRNLIIFPFFWISCIFYPLKCAFFLPSFAKITNILSFPHKKGGKKSPKEPLSTLYHAHSVSLRQKRALLHHQYSHQSQDSVEFRQSSVNHGVSLYIVSLRDTYDTAGRNLTLTDSREQTNQTHT